MRHRQGLQWVIPTAGLLVLGLPPFAAPSLAEERRETLRAGIGDLSGAKSVEVRDSAGTAVLRGQFVVGSRRSDDNERIAALKAPGANGTAVESNAPAQDKNANGGRKNGDKRDDGDKGRDGKGKGDSGVARGKVEIETTTRFFGLGNSIQKVELSARGLTAGVKYNLLIDGKQIASFDATPRGRAEIVWEGPVPR